MEYCGEHKISQIDLGQIRDRQLFHNEQISRRASVQLIRAVFDDLEKKARFLPYFVSIVISNCIVALRTMAINSEQKNFAYLTSEKESGVLSQISFSKLSQDLADWARHKG